MFERILVPVDLTPKNRLAVEGACRVLLPDGELVLVHVVEKLADDNAELESFYRLLESKAREELSGLMARADELGARARSEVLLGHRGEEIVRAAERERADLIVLASHRVDPERPLAEGLSLSYRIALFAPCPVLLMK
ncbi:MAG: universal stress protein [Acidobacteria bacterium]|nr:universal stress protein [Acidobacteriota bacterium]MCB9377157.1 universal stress protein [Holophagales bacterium]